VFFHGAMEIPDISKKIHKFPETDYTTVEFLALEIQTSEDAKKLVQLYIHLIQKLFSAFPHLWEKCTVGLALSVCVCG
jgi:hypothetical protein